MTEQAAERADRLGGYLKESDGDRILADVEDLLRRQPWLAAGGGIVVGFLASRFLKASSSRRYELRAGEGVASYPRGDASVPLRAGQPVEALSDTPHASPARREEAVTAASLSGGREPGARQ